MAMYLHEGSEVKCSDTNKATLMCNLAPAKEELKIRGVRKISNNGILTISKEDMERVLNNEKPYEAGL